MRTNSVFAKDFNFGVAGDRIFLNGNVGIGTTNPDARLHVVNDSTTYSPSLTVGATAAEIFGSYGTELAMANTGSTFWMQTRQGVANSWPLSLNPLGGNVGIGTTAPGKRLDIVGASASDGLKVQGEIVSGYPANLYMYVTSANANARDWMLQTNGDNWGDFAIKSSTANAGDPYSGTTQFVINKLGNVGIGTTAPGAKLDVTVGTGSGADATPGLKISQAVLDATPKDAIYLYENGGQADGKQYISWYNGNQSYYKARMWATAGGSYQNTNFGIDVADNARNIATRLAINNGNVGINTTAPGVKLDVSGALRATAITDSALGAGLVMSDASGNLSTGGSVAAASGWTVSGTTVYKTDTNGSVGIGVTTVNASNKLDIVGGGLYIAAADGHADASLHITTSYGGYDRLTQIAPTGVSKPGLNLMGSTDATGTNQWWVWGPTSANIWQIQAGTGFSGSAGLSINTSGNVGIGTTGPGYKLSVTADAVPANDALTNGSSQLVIQGATDPNKKLEIGFNTTANYGWISTGITGTAYKPLVLQPIAGDGGSGNVGIGTTAPGARLQVASAGDAATSYTARFQSSANITGSGGILFDQGSTYSYKLVSGSTSSATGGQLLFSYINPTTGADVTSNILTLQSNGNVGINTTGPGVKLDVSGALRATAITDTTLGAGNICTDASGNLYVCTLPTATNYWSANGTSIYNNTSGNVGIGTTGPSQKLDVQGNIAVSTNVLGGGSGYGAAGSSSYATLQMYSGATGFTTLNNQGFGIDLQTGGTSRVYIQNNGNVGIGTTNPGVKLDVSGTMRSFGPNGDTPAVSINGGGAGSAGFLISEGPYMKVSAESGGSGFRSWGAYNNGSGWIRTYVGLPLSNIMQDTSGNIALMTDTSTSGTPSFTSRLFIQNNGNVGIGTTAPGATLQVVGNIYNSGSLYTDKVVPYSSNQLSLLNGGANYLYINGNVGIGTTNPAQKISIEGANAKIRLGNTAHDTGQLGIEFDNRVNGGSGTEYIKTAILTVPSPGYTGYGRSDLYFSNNGTADSSSYNTAADVRMAITSQGNVGIGNTSPQNKLQVTGDIGATGFVYNSSDRSLKKNIETIQDPLGKIMKLRGVTFNWKKDNTPAVGLIAQEVQTVYPELVTGAEGSKEVAYSNLVAPLIEAVKAQQLEIKNNDAEINTLKAQQAETIKLNNSLLIRIKALETKAKKR